MNTAIVAIVSALSLVGVGTTAVAMSGGMMVNSPMMGDGMHGMGHDHGYDHGPHDCHCCDGDGDWNETETDLNQLSLGP